LFTRATRCCSRINCATVFSLTRHPASRRSAAIRGDPYEPRCAAKICPTSTANCRRRQRRLDASPSRHLSNQAWLTPNARHAAACEMLC